ncbi:MAG: ATP-binding cassette domain-containing protein [Desulfotignum sp.]|nr:ATP-binding cassette domain-containing protein [Desulfotignum sp.]
MKIIHARTNHLFIEQFQALPGQAWTIVGANRSGIDDFFDLVSGRAIDCTAVELILPDQLGVVCFKNQQAVYESELKKDQTDYLDRLDPGTPARKFLHNPDRHEGLIRAMDMFDCLDKGFRQLSTGQVRKLMILAQITKRVFCLVIQAPFDGLDAAGCRELDHALYQLFSRGTQIMLFVCNPEDIPAWTTHIGIMADGRLVRQGPASRVSVQCMDETHMPDFLAALPDMAQTTGAVSDLRKKPGKFPAAKEMIRLVQGHAGYGGNLVFKDLNLVVAPGEHTLITGPNGSGKSTLLQVITGDHPACYTNNLTLFNIRRGTGESVWDIKRRMGIVSSDLHRNFRVPGSALDCIVSGLFDSIGLYRPVTEAEKDLGRAWLARLGMEKQETVSFRELSYADQRLVLIARALIKNPPLLVLDEPTQGLDAPSRCAVLNFLETVASAHLATILYVSHRKDEFRSFFRQHVKLEKTEPPGSPAT